MANVCVLCKLLCVNFFLISTFSPGYSSSDIYHYDTHSVPANREYLSFIPQSDDSILRKKRDVEPPNPATTPVVPTTNITHTATTKPTELHLNSSIVSPSSTVAPPDTTTTKRLNQKFIGNLGVNGTGIRKNVTKDEHHNVAAAPPDIVVSSSTTTAKTTVVVKDDSDFSDISNFSEDAVNKTLIQNNITKTQNDTHQFYNSTFTVDPTVGHKYWIDMTNRSDVKINELLSQSHRRAATVRLSFDFPFYGHVIRNITIATGGFLYTGEYVHSWLAATQYIAPLMANFDTSLSNDSCIKYLDNGTSFTVQWEKVSLQDKPNDGDFTFQTTLHSNGDIIFVYQNIPIVIEKIQDDHHPVKVGLSDAYISDRTIFFVRRKTIYEYHRVNFNREDIRNWTVIYLSALPTCLSNKDCKSCVTQPNTDFQCSWCPNTNRCSSGMDRHRQDWLSRNCEKTKIRTSAQCSQAIINNSVSLQDLADTHSYESVESDHHQPLDNPRQAPRITNNMNMHSTDKTVRMGVSGIVTILFLISLVVALGVWIMYAYRNPHSTSGQILIRYRPSQWSWKRGEARYTAATIHM